MQVNTSTYSSVASSRQVSSVKADENTKKSNVKSAGSSQNVEQSTLDKLNSLKAKGLTQLYFIEFSQQTMNVALSSANVQSGLTDLLGSPDTQGVSSILSRIDFAALGYVGKNPLDMDTEELNKLLGEDGFFGMNNTASRIADFVIQGAGDDLEKLQKGFEGVKRGFEEAQKMWGGKLPQISQDTMKQTLEKISKHIEELGGKALDLRA